MLELNCTKLLRRRLCESKLSSGPESGDTPRARSGGPWVESDGRRKAQALAYSSRYAGHGHLRGVPEKPLPSPHHSVDERLVSSPGGDAWPGRAL